jgi:hypothetical protein
MENGGRGKWQTENEGKIDEDLKETKGRKVGNVNIVLIVLYFILPQKPM